MVDESWGTEVPLPRIRVRISLAANRSGEKFRRNLVEMRVEGRFGFEVLRPQAFAVVELAAA